MKNLTPLQKHKFIKIVLTLSVIFIISAVFFIIPLRPTISETEKRELAKFPEFSVNSLLDGSYFSEIGVWFSDTVPFRDTLMDLNSKVQNFLGTARIHAGFNEGNAGDDIPDITSNDSQTLAFETLAFETTQQNPETTNEQPTADITTTQTEQSTQNQQNENDNQNHHFEQLGSILICDNAGYEYYNFVQESADNYAKAINTAVARFSDKANIYVTIAPSSADITLAEKVRNQINVSNQKNAINYMMGSITSQAKKFDCYDTIKNHKDEYVYFRTDHHWTALGAYYAYELFCNTKGIAPLPLTSYKEIVFDGFLGTFYNDSGNNPALGATPDTVYAYEPPCEYSMKVTDKNGETYSLPLLYDETNAQPSNKYSTFISGDNPLSVIENASNPNGEACLVIKESYGNAFVPFLVYHYKTVYVIDYRHYTKSLNEFLSTYKVDDIIFVNNISMTRNKKLVDNLGYFVSK